MCVIVRQDQPKHPRPAVLSQTGNMPSSPGGAAATGLSGPKYRAIAIQAITIFRGAKSTAGGWRCCSANTCCTARLLLGRSRLRCARCQAIDAHSRNTRCVAFACPESLVRCTLGGRSGGCRGTLAITIWAITIWAIAI